MTVTRTTNAAGVEVVTCDVCRDGRTLVGLPEWRDNEEAWFRGRHRHETSELPPSLEMAARRKRT